MNHINRQKPLKASNSFETNCTIDDQADKGIKINIFLPKKKTSTLMESSDDYLTYSKDSEDVLTESVKKHDFASVAADKKQKGFGIMTLKSQNSPGQSSITYRQNAAKNISTNTNIKQIPINSTQKTGKQIQNKGNSKLQVKQLNFKEANQSVINQKDHIVQIAEKITKKLEKNDSILIDISQDESFREGNELQIIDLDEKPILTALNQEKKQIKPIIPPIKISENLPRRSIIQSERSSHQSKSNSKIKLRDYLYMVEATSKQTSQRKNERKNENTTTTPKSSEIQNPPKLQTTSREPARPMTERSTPVHASTPRRQHALLKYSISNSKMYDILKKQIHDDIKLVEKNLEKVDDELADLQIHGETEPTNEQLLILYNIRRQIKEEMNKKLQNTIRLIKDHKKGINSDFPNQALKRKLPNNQHQNQH